MAESHGAHCDTPRPLKDRLILWGESLDIHFTFNNQRTNVKDISVSPALSHSCLKHQGRYVRKRLCEEL
ncbi:hypothetical protein EYF80_001835 [Liparis tanakae]|uniref:Uncharacterized protein n=1 Tax=Liparis tanakae TaxID=230148 RepID=A0A4Z2JCZ2_9TELE|nr:hypothetical protein EYF80_001835 [Liparis tanakae]